VVVCTLNACVHPYDLPPRHMLLGTAGKLSNLLSVLFTRSPKSASSKS